MKLKHNINSKRTDFGGAMTDISFLLIVFFLVTAVFVSEEGILSSLPNEDTIPQEVKIDKVLRIEMLREEIKMNAKSYASLEEVVQRVAELVEIRSDLVALVSVEEGIKYQSVVTLLSEIKSKGVSDFTVVTGTEAQFSSKLLPITVPDNTSTVSNAKE